MRLQFPALVLLVLITGLAEEREDALAVALSDVVNAVLMLAAVAKAAAVVASRHARIIKLFYI